VGKTTCASAAALRLAHGGPEDAVLLVSTDPAHSLRDSLTDVPLPGNLEIVEFDARACLNEFKNDHNQTLREIASRGTFLDDQDISRFLDLSLPGLDELMALLKIGQWVAEEKYLRIVVDTAPTGHTLRLLSMPELIQRWLDALDALLAKHRYMKKLFAGAYTRDKLDEFLLNLSAEVNRMKVLLADSDRCRFIPVTIPEPLSVQETMMLVEELKKSRIAVSDIVINRLYPENDCPVCSDQRSRQIGAIRHLTEHLPGYALWGIPLYPKEIIGPSCLGSFWQGAFLMKGTKLSTAIMKDEPDRPVRSGKRRMDGVVQNRVENPAALPSSKTKLLIFAGKGGVGKTTLACATAVKMACAFQNREVFLFSTDPAHSLSGCLDVPIGPAPTRLAPGLTAMEIDSQAEFDTLKNHYAEELEQFLNDISSSFDLTFDREVMERIMDLSPPGIDEIMALTRAMGFLTRGRYQVFILDSAPTGHLIRLLETPDMIDQWLKAFFSLFLKYKRIFRLPKISGKMVEISKGLKSFRNLLENSDESALYAVSILTEMAFEETGDLVDACRRMNVAVPLIFLNIATPDNDCPLCSAVFKRESKLKKKFQHMFSEKRQPLVYVSGDPRGLERLKALGDALYNQQS